jgi:hypothetical protein
VGRAFCSGIGDESGSSYRADSDHQGKVCSFDAADAGGQIRAQKASVGGFISQPPRTLMVEGARFFCSRKN